MDSLSQVALGAAVGVAVMGHRTVVWKAASWGAVAGTLPDLDVLIDHGDPILNMVLHRAETHAPFWLTLFALPFGAAVAQLSGQSRLWRRWVLAMWAVLVTHPLLDGMTVYGTQLGLPFTDQPYGVGSIFIIDPLYTLLLLVGTAWALCSRDGMRGGGRGLTANAAGLVLSTAYLAWGAWAQQHVTGVARAALVAQGIVADRLLVTPAPLNTLLWRVVAVQGDTYHEGFRSLLDSGPTMAFDRFERRTALWPAVQALEGAQRIAAFSHGFWALDARGDRLHITDLRMGQEPAYVFRFALAQRQGDAWVPLPVPEQVGMRPEVGLTWVWLWRRALGQAVSPPR
jgi:inner membrane protein